jgi:SAM-dependent methyltransferase
MPGQYQRIGDALAADGFPTGGETELFEEIGRHQFLKLFQSGLMPNDRVLDIGCGCLRGGFFLIHYLEPGGYFGIEPNPRMLQAGVDRVLGRYVLDEKRPTFTNRDDFEFDEFGVKFDFYIARSIWSHASLPQIATMLESFKRTANRGAVFLASYVPTESADEEYHGEEFSWPAIRYRFSTLSDLVAQHDLSISEEDEVAQQRWLRISGPPSACEPAPV